MTNRHGTRPPHVTYHQDDNDENQHRKSVFYSFPIGLQLRCILASHTGGPPPCTKQLCRDDRPIPLSSSLPYYCEIKPSSLRNEDASLSYSETSHKFSSSSQPPHPSPPPPPPAPNVLFLLSSRSKSIEMSHS